MDEPNKEWRCFHCDEVFTDASCARRHFGRDEGSTPACQIKGAEGGLLRALREAEDAAAEAWHALHNENSDIARAYAAQSCRVSRALKDTEELAWEKGLYTDLGIDFIKEAQRAFGSYLHPEPGVPQIDAGGKARLKYWAGMLAMMAQALKDEAAELNREGRKTEGVLLIRVQLSVEETGEWAEALANGDLVQAAKELSDISYVTDGHYLTLGLADLKLPVYRANHAANMSKLGEDGKPIISEAGRWVKGPNYRPADEDIFRILSDASRQ
jgi:predicted HAD superfamily Cof-like phosphohydrolase